MQPQPDRTYTWAERLEWEGDDRWELIDGVPYAMSSPSLLHQVLAMELSGRLYPQFREGRCRLLAAPFDVKLSSRDVVQPDLLVICTQDRLQASHLEGPPELAVEILSPSNERHDRLRKLAGSYGEKDRFASPTFPELQLDLMEIFQSLPSPDALREAPPPYSTV